MTNVDYFVLGLVLCTLFWVFHFLYFPDNLKKLYMGMTIIAHNDRRILMFPNIMIISTYLAACVIFVQTYS